MHISCEALFSHPIIPGEITRTSTYCPLSVIASKPVSFHHNSPKTWGDPSRGSNVLQPSRWPCISQIHRLEGLMPCWLPGSCYCVVLPGRRCDPVANRNPSLGTSTISSRQSSSSSSSSSPYLWHQHFMPVAFPPWSAPQSRASRLVILVIHSRAPRQPPSGAVATTKPLIPRRRGLHRPTLGKPEKLVISRHTDPLLPVLDGTSSDTRGGA